jgi:hypothetical protein
VIQEMPDPLTSLDGSEVATAEQILRISIFWVSPAIGAST